MPRLAVACCVLPLACATAQTAEPARFEQVGVIEGFYGPPWSHQDRLDILAFMGRVGLTHYYYAPKDDPFHRARWREPYPDSAYRSLGELASAATAVGVTFVYAISPGGSMVYADSADYDRLLAKLDAIMALGIGDVALMLDDVPPTLQHDEDRGAFPSLAAAHAAVINRLHADLAARGATLAVTPTTYTDAWGDRAYLQELGALVPSAVPFFWTGTDVAAPNITVTQAATWSELTGRMPLVWDNYPVNDFARWRLFLGPLRERAPDLPRGARGLIANPMNEAHASMIPLATLAFYAHTPDRYDPDVALDAALDTLYGSAAPLLQPFLRAYGDYAFARNVFEPLFIPTNRFAVAPIEGMLDELTDALRALDSAVVAQPQLRGVIKDLQPFVDRTTMRLRRFQADRAWVRHGDSLLYRTDRDQVRVSALDAAIRIDGDVTDWPAGAWDPLGNGGTARYAAGMRDDTLFLAVAVTSPALRVAAGDRIADGDHLALMLQAGEDARRQYLTSDDLLLLLSPDEAMIRRLPFHGFMAKYLADNVDLRWSEFLLSTFGVAVQDGGWRTGARRQRTGWSAEIAIPLEGRQVVRMSLTVTSVTNGGRRVGSLAARNYPANPATFATLVLTR